MAFGSLVFKILFPPKFVTQELNLLKVVLPVGIMPWRKAFASAIRFKSLKSEMIYQHDFKTSEAAKQATFKYIEICRAAGAVQRHRPPCGNGGIHRWGIFPLLTIIMGNFNMSLKDLSSIVLQVQVVEAEVDKTGI